MAAEEPDTRRLLVLHLGQRDDEVGGALVVDPRRVLPVDKAVW